MLTCTLHPVSKGDALAALAAIASRNRTHLPEAPLADASASAAGQRGLLGVAGSARLRRRAALMLCAWCCANAVRPALAHCHHRLDLLPEPQGKDTSAYAYNLLGVARGWAISSSQWEACATLTSVEACDRNICSEQSVTCPDLRGTQSWVHGGAAVLRDDAADQLHGGGTPTSISSWALRWRRMRSRPPRLPLGGWGGEGPWPSCCCRVSRLPCSEVWLCMSWPVARGHHQKT